MNGYILYLVCLPHYLPYTQHFVRSAFYKQLQLNQNGVPKIYFIIIIIIIIIIIKNNYCFTVFCPKINAFYRFCFTDITNRMYNIKCFCWLTEYTPNICLCISTFFFLDVLFWLKELW